MTKLNIVLIGLILLFFCRCAQQSVPGSSSVTYFPKVLSWSIISDSGFSQSGRFKDGDWLEIVFVSGERISISNQGDSSKEEVFYVPPPAKSDMRIVYWRLHRKVNGKPSVGAGGIYTGENIKMEQSKRQSNLDGK